MSVVCATLRISRAGFYAWRSEEESARAQRDRELLPLVRDVFWRHKRRYGARRIAFELGVRGEPCSRSGQIRRHIRISLQAERNESIELQWRLGLSIMLISSTLRRLVKTD